MTSAIIFQIKILTFSFFPGKSNDHDGILDVKRSVKPSSSTEDKETIEQSLSATDRTDKDFKRDSKQLLAVWVILFMHESTLFREHRKVEEMIE